MKKKFGKKVVDGRPTCLTQTQIKAWFSRRCAALKRAAIEASLAATVSPDDDDDDDDDGACHHVPASAPDPCFSDPASLRCQALPRFRNAGSTRRNLSGTVLSFTKCCVVCLLLQDGDSDGGDDDEEEEDEEEDDLDDLRVADLKLVLKQLGLKVSGRKADLIDRIRSAEKRA